MTTPVPDRKGKSRLISALAGLFFLAWLVAVFFAVRDTFINDAKRSEPGEGAAMLALPDAGKGRFPILDRGGRELAVSFPTKSVYARPLELEHPDAVALFLARELGLSERELKRNLKEERSFVWLGRQISETAVNNILARKLRGIYVVDEVQRFYPQGNLAAQLLGVAREGRGLTGIEAQFDQQLQTEVELADANLPPRGPVVLTLDLRIQELVERELAQLTAATGATGGEGIVLDPRSGEVLALVNQPAFDPNFFWDSAENSRTNRVLSLALPASGFGQLLRMAASPQPVQVVIPAAPAPPSPPKRDRLAALRKELRRSNVPPPGTFGSGPNRLLPFKGGYRSPGLAALEKVTEPPGFSTFLAGLGFGQKMLMDLPIGTVAKAEVGELRPTLMASGGELLAALAGVLRVEGVMVPKVVAGVAEPQTGRLLAPPKSELSTAAPAVPLQSIQDYLSRLPVGTDGAILLEEVTEVPPPVKETETVPEEAGEENGRKVGEVWTPALTVPAANTTETKIADSAAGAAGAAGPEQETAGTLVGSPAAEKQEEGKEEPRRFISILVALPGPGQTSEVLLLLALEGAALDPAGPSPLRLAAERMLPQIRIWAAEHLGPPASIAWSANEALWQAQWQKMQNGREARISLTSLSDRKKMPDLKGASLRKALQVLNQYDLKVRIQGGGRVVEHQPAAGSTIIPGDECLLTLSGLNLIDVRPDREVTVGVESGSNKLKIFSTIYNPRPVAVGD